MTDDARFLKRKVKGGSIDVHPTERALVVNYELEATILGELGDPMLGERKECQKIIRVKTLGPDTNVSKLANQIIDKCKLIHPSKHLEIEQLLYYLQNRKEDTKDQSAAKKLQSPDGINGLYAPTFQLGADIEDTANINDVEDYLEQLYESTDDKIRATGLILQLARNPDNLEELFENETVVGALARVLREDWKKSTELATNIIYVFFCFSSFTQFHGVIAHFKIGSLTIQIVEHELKKYDMWKSELDAKKESMKKFTSSQKKEFDKNMLQVSCLILKQEQLLRVSFYMLLNLSENIETEQKMCSKGIVNMLMESLKRDNFELIILVVSFLKKLSVFSDNVNIMKEKGIVEFLAPQIPCKHDDQLNITLRLLLNLSFEEQLREKMVKQLLLPKLVSILSKDKHVLIVLCILYHLSLDDKSKSLFTYTECIPVIMRMLLTSPLTTAIPTRSAQYDSEDEHDVDLMGGVGGGGGADFKHSRRAGDLRDGSSTTAVNPPVDLELIALAVNLAANKQCAELICGQDGEGLKLLMKRAFKYKDALYLKVIRNIAKHDGDMKMHFINYLSDLSLVLKDDVFSFNEFTLECIGILSQITIKDIDYELLLKEYGLVEWISEKLDPKSNTPDDFLLEIIVLVGTVCNDDSCAQLLSATQIIQHLIRLLNARQEDDEMVLQIVYVFHQMIFHPSTRHVIVGATEAPAYLIDLMHDKNKHVRSVCDSTLDIIAEYDEEWAKKILVEKFRWHNSQWLEMVESQDGRQGDFLEPVYDAAGQPMITDDDESPFSPIYLHDPTVLDRSDMFYDEYNTEAEMNEEFLSDPMMKAQYEYAAASAAQVQSGYDAHEDDRQYD